MVTRINAVAVSTFREGRKRDLRSDMEAVRLSGPRETSPAMTASYTPQ